MAAAHAAADGYTARVMVFRERRLGSVSTRAFRQRRQMHEQRVDKPTMPTLAHLQPRRERVSSDEVPIAREDSADISSPTRRRVYLPRSDRARWMARGQHEPQVRQAKRQARLSDRTTQANEGAVAGFPTAGHRLDRQLVEARLATLIY